MKASPFLLFVKAELESVTGLDIEIHEIHPEFGGSINESFKLETSAGNYFLKRNLAADYPGMFIHEAEGLNLLRYHSSFKIPHVFVTGVFREHAFILMEYLDKGIAQLSFWKDFGYRLAEMHKQTQEHFGFGQDNYIGRLPQSNTPKASWADFYTGERIVPMVSMAHNKGRLDLETVKQFEKLCYKAAELFPAEPPALLHGDLWSGNYICTTAHQPGIFDPAAYYGHREMDLAMMLLFGGFHTDTFKAYEETYPLTPGWRKRADLYNLYPLLVHVNLFGGNYIKKVKTILNAYI